VPDVKEHRNKKQSKKKAAMSLTEKRNAKKAKKQARMNSTV
jgi:hypothetical protein